MNKYIISKSNCHLISEYDIESNYISISYSDGSKEQIPYSIDRIKYLDKVMVAQYNDYEFDVTDLKTIIINDMLKQSKIEELKDDYSKDTVLLNNYELLEKSIKEESYYNKLSPNLKQKVKDIHNGSLILSINSIRNLNTRDLSNLLCNAKRAEKTRIRK